MSKPIIIFTGGSIFTGEQLLHDHKAVFCNGRLQSIQRETGSTSHEGDAQVAVINLQGDILTPGFTDLQVNGGGGVMLNDAPSVEKLKIIATAHRSLGTTSLLPTLITDTAQITSDAIIAAINAIDQGVDGIAGLHLEGPHLSVARKGAHDASLIRPMQPDDLSMLLDAATQLPVLKVTIAPENVTVRQCEALVAAGVLVSLGHTDAGFNTCIDYQRAGVFCVTHLFNAMSQMGSREPGLVGAALDCGGFNIGLIADGIHVHTATMRHAWAAKRGPGKFYLVSDAMAPAATQLQRFTLNGRTIHRNHGHLTLADGTLAGADLDLLTAVRVMHREVGVELVDALKAAITTPRQLLQGHQLNDIAASEPLDNYYRIDPQLESIRSVVGDL